ncbi:hypothetical protein [Siccirubricoccus sp. G192]|uniref:hypothetical protein n=1 Tax=Siccirubricoccus sp. G192 TaxID=2849651 RepID=UPI001C2BA21F|nr:hypothetical protein [Siccirubricoccus sp. G192]MBV1798312.1 hypothetical protein [Siccirubricoccus sp. G192]
MPKLPLWFLVAAATCLLGGVCMGIAMGIAHDFRFSPVHAHLNLLGWTSLSLMGLTYRAYPELAERRVPALAQFILSAGAAVVFPVGIWLAIAHDAPGLAIGAALVWLAGVVLFLARLIGLLLRRAPAECGRAPVLLAAE